MNEFEKAAIAYIKKLVLDTMGIQISDCYAKKILNKDIEGFKREWDFYNKSN